MANLQTTKQRQKKNEWLRRNPVFHAWLLANIHTNLSELCQQPQAILVANSLKEAGVYGEKTVKADIMSSMRRWAVRADLAEITPHDQARADIEAILARPEVDRKAILKELRK